MDTISYFKLQSKNFIRDFKTRQRDSDNITFYTPRFFDDIDDIIVSYDIDEDDFSLMNAQHHIALLAGFESWSDLINASDAALELGKLLFDNRDKGYAYPLVANWEMYIRELEGLYNFLDDETKLEIFKKIFLEKI